jgi:hypothetical protein
MYLSKTNSSGRACREASRCTTGGKMPAQGGGHEDERMR